MEMHEGSNVRYIKRNGELVLQQCIKFIEYDNKHNPIAGGTKWMDIPIVEEDKS